MSSSGSRRYNDDFNNPDMSDDDEEDPQEHTVLPDAWAFGAAGDDMEEIAENYSFVIESKAYEVRSTQ